MRRIEILCLVIFSVVATSCSSRSTTPLDAQARGDFAHPEVFQGGGLPRDFTRFTSNTYSGNYGGIVVGTDNNMWFLDTGGPGLVKITMSGTATEYPLPSNFPYDLAPIAISQAPNNQFFILACGGRTGQGSLEVVNTRGRGSAFQLPQNDLGECTPNSLATGPDGNAWFAGTNDIDRITPSGVITQYPNFGSYDGITSGPNGLMWFTDNATVGSINPATGTITNYSVGTSPSCCANPIVAAADGNLWFVCSCETTSIARMTPTGQFTFYPISFPDGVVAGAIGPGGWPFFASSYPGLQPQVIRVNVNNGSQRVIQSPYGLDTFSAITAGPDGNVWMTTLDGHVVVYILKILRVSPTSLNFSSPQLQAGLTAKETGNPTLAASSSNTGIATVAPGQNSNTFVVTSTGIGNCTITIQDAIGNSAEVSVVVQ